MSQASQTFSLFVYGTLKRGQLREGIWPHAPKGVEAACIRADLFDLGPYPAIRTGEGWVLGELWTFEPIHLKQTLVVLDEAEGFGQVGEPDVYRRQVVEAVTISKRLVSAFAYFMQEPGRLDSARPIPCTLEWNGYRCAVWPDALARVPKSLDEERQIEEEFN